MPDMVNWGDRENDDALRGHEEFGGETCLVARDF